MAYIEKNKADFERLIEQDRQAMAREMPDSLGGMLGSLVGLGKGKGKEGEEKGKEGKAGGAGKDGKE